jgi:hypothetical protein
MEMKRRLTMQLSYAQIPRRPMNLMDLKDVFQFVAPRVRDAALKTAAQLNQLGIRYALAGGLAVGAHGYVRATVDVDFLVGEEAFEHHGSMVAFKAGVPIEVDGVRINYLSSISLGPQLEEVLDHPPMNEGLAIVPIEVLIYMKLVAKRRRDLVDVIELVKAGADVNRVRNSWRDPQTCGQGRSSLGRRGIQSGSGWGRRSASSRRDPSRLETR